MPEIRFAQTIVKQPRHPTPATPIGRGVRGRAALRPAEGPVKRAHPDPPKLGKGGERGGGGPADGGGTFKPGLRPEANASLPSAIMSAAVFFGCTFIAFGPAFGLLLFTVAGDPLRVIILVAGSFFWLVSLLLSSLLWFVAVQLSNKANAGVQHGLLMMGAGASVLLQEAFRFAYYKLLKKADQGLAAMSEDGRSPISIGQMAYVSGLAFGIASGAFSVINVLSDSLGPGMVGIHGDSPYFFLTSAFLTMAVVLLHTSWGVVFFDACEKRRWLALTVVVVTHMLTSGLTFLNPRYELSLPLIYGLTIATGGWAFSTAGGSVQNIWRCVTFSR
ncbi:gamma-secretase subunit APH-1A-like isoform X3 [Rhincodon typus]|uniref:gamma-secretase subunit APH-1A-like isoform X3 n=1 Tax=Rhincodon typus TaxID=259920 RepID=UPI00202E9B8F|nr:gamma-secretase subunit APH-1A-like isoform X3 [Rhincodon typus]